MIEIIAFGIILFVALASSLWIGLGLLIASVVLLSTFTNLPVGLLLSQHLFNFVTTPDLIALPLFIMLGEVLLRTKLSAVLFNGLAPLAQLFPGKLLHVNIAASTLFAAVSGSSAATTQVVGRASMFELLDRGYSPRVAIGSLAGAGTIGFLIPPSIVMIVYGVLSNTSIIQLFIAGVVPGLLLAMSFSAWIMLSTLRDPSLVPKTEQSYTFFERILALREIAPVILLIVCVLGSMYAGFATPSEAAALGVLGALIIAAAQGELSLSSLQDIVVHTIVTSSMIGLIAAGASILSIVAALLGIPQELTGWISAANLPPLGLIIFLMLLYLLLGCFLDSFSIIVLTLPLALPAVVEAGFEPLWFGIFVIVMVELSQITPPVGFNLFVLRSLTGRSIMSIAGYAAPYAIVLLLFALFIAIFPEVVLFLPRWVSE